MRVQMDTVQGTELQKSTTTGFFTRCGILYLTAGDLPALKANADSRVVLNGLTTAGVPLEGDKLSSTYTDWICVDRRIRPFNAKQLQIICVYRWLGGISVRDHTSLQETQSTLTPVTDLSDNKVYLEPVYNVWVDPNPAPGTTARTIRRLCHFRDFLPIRNLTFTKTVRFEASSAVLLARKTTNSVKWQGLDAGYWLVTDIDGQTLDNGITFTYTVTFSTQTDFDWSSYNILKDDRGQEVYVSPTDFKTLALKPYVYAKPDNTTCQGVTKVGRFVPTDFPTIFGINP